MNQNEQNNSLELDRVLVFQPGQIEHTHSKGSIVDVTINTALQLTRTGRSFHILSVSWNIYTDVSLRL